MFSGPGKKKKGLPVTALADLIKLSTQTEPGPSVSQRLLCFFHVGVVATVLSSVGGEEQTAQASLSGFQRNVEDCFLVTRIDLTRFPGFVADRQRCFDG